MQQYCATCGAPKKGVSAKKYSEDSADMVPECGHNIFVRELIERLDFDDELGLKTKTGEPVRNKPAREMKARVKGDVQKRIIKQRTEKKEETAVTHEVYEGGELVDKGCPSERTRRHPSKTN